MNIKNLINNKVQTLINVINIEEKFIGGHSNILRDWYKNIQIY